MENIKRMPQFSNLEEIRELTPTLLKPEKPIQNQTDMVELLVLVVDDLCVQIGEIREKGEKIT